MKAIILAGGLGSRLSEETNIKPKPMVEIGDKPIIWHIMKHLSFFNINHFIICCGYKGEVIKNYFYNYQLSQSDIRINIINNQIKFLNKKKDNWTIDLIDTGQKTNTGGRLKKIKKFLKNDENFLMTYGDGLTNLNINKLIHFHKKNKGKAIVTSVQPAGRYGNLKFLRSKIVTNFLEKPKGDNNWINGGYFILNKKHLDTIDNFSTAWEGKPLKKLVQQKKLMAFEHSGFWKSMDTLSDKVFLENLWNMKKAPWKVWK